jgi:hypothetical protein
MPRNRVIYQSEALFNTKDTVDVSASTPPQTGALFINQFSRVQSCNYNFNIARRDVNQFGNLAAIDRIILEQPTVGVDFTYLLTDMANEKNLGFSVIEAGITGIVNITSAVATQSCLSGILTSGFVNTKNYFIRTVTEGNDASAFATDTAANQTVGSTIGLGNGFLTNYSINAAVGDFPTASVSLECLNMNFSNGNSGVAPGVTTAGNIAGGNFVLPQATGNPNGENALGKVSALRHGDISFSLVKTEGQAYGGTDLTTSAAIQNFSISMGLNRTPLQKIGSRYAYSREIDFPVTVTLSVTALVQDLTTGNLVDLVNTDGLYDAVITLAAPAIANTDLIASEGVGYVMKRLNLDSQDFSSSIGANKQVTLNFSTQVGSPQQNDRGLFMLETLPLH